MGNKILKIVLPLILIGVIAFVIHKANKTFNASKPTPVGEFSFNSYIDSLIKYELGGKPYAQAKEDYRRIYDVIHTEEQITRTNSSGGRDPLSSPDSVQYCYQEAFAAYWPIYEAEVEGIFKSDWSNKTDRLEEIKSEAQFLTRRAGAIHQDSLTKYMAYVSDYYTITAFANKESRDLTSRSLKEYNKILEEKNGYQKKYPICNNKSLCNQLDKVPGKAKQRWENSVQWYVTETCKATDLEIFLNGFKSGQVSVGKSVCESKIKEFCDNFSNKELSKQKTQLNNTWASLLATSVDDACRINNYRDFYPVYTKLNSRITEYENKNTKGALNYLKNRLETRNGELLNVSSSGY